MLLARDDPRATDVLRAAGAYLDDVAARIDEDDLREGFLRDVAANVETGPAPAERWTITRRTSGRTGVTVDPAPRVSGEGITMNVPRRVWTRVAVVVALLVGIQGDAGAGSSRPGDLLPDLQMAQIYGMDLQTTRGGRIRLHFGTIGWNLGDGPIEARGQRNARGDLVMRVTQRIYRAAAGSATASHRR